MLKKVYMYFASNDIKIPHPVWQITFFVSKYIYDVTRVGNILKLMLALNAIAFGQGKVWNLYIYNVYQISQFR